jgi:sterol desaturase/sphingolipid hydroxylase (fatty acid hydroxylase superfamily)
MFENPVLELASRVHPAVPPLLYLPVVTVCLVLAVGREDLSVASVVGVFFLGLVFWTFAEYVLHRFVFHFEPDTRWGRRLHFIIHGVHHDYPHDPMRLVMPPSVSVPLAFLVFLLFRFLLGPVWSLPFFAGFLIGYLIYDMTHFHIHHHRSDNRLSLALRRYHYRHHFQQSDRGYGVTSSIWDRIFRTTPVLRKLS